MGGGDLNLKKSWHPSTLRNIERVWKAEQQHEAEQKKIEQLQKELEEERGKEEIQQFAEETGVIKKKQDRLDWMYQGPAGLVNREDYLLGRHIDKTFDMLQQAEEEKEAENINELGEPSTGVIDVANKVREDPLFTIRKKELEEKKKLITNPVKMKQLKQLLQQSVGKKDKKKKKKKRKKKQTDSSGDETVYVRKSKVKNKEKSSGHLKYKYVAGDGNTMKNHYMLDENKKNHHKHDLEVHSDKEKRRRKQQYGLIVMAKTKVSLSSSHIETKNEELHRSNSNRSYVTNNRKHASSMKEKRSRSRSPKRKLSAEEKEKIRQEMLKMLSGERNNEQRMSEDIKKRRRKERKLRKLCHPKHLLIQCCLKQFPRGVWRNVSKTTSTISNGQRTPWKETL
ncbi:uncharacterized protein LOC143228368 [Tachypleus tridentatus]|uniref:uncharacterized protein LOC143228368 n=1 Tax=Tachypleus tridentatus TaxID=6853 RepID=UPI003FD12F23